MDYSPLENILAQGEPIAASLVTEIPFDYFRVYSPSYSIPQQTAAYWRLELADGISPLQLSAYSQMMRAATGVPVDGYSVTLPPFESGQPAIDNASYQPDARLLGLLNVRYVVAEYPLAVQGLSLIGQQGTSYLYRNEEELPRAWVQETTSEPGMNPRPATGLLRSPNRLDILAQGPGLLVAAEVDYPGWLASVDGVEEQIQPVAGVLRGVTLSDGMHQVRMEFRPVGFFLGLGISIACLAACLIAFLGASRRAL